MTKYYIVGSAMRVYDEVNKEIETMVTMGFTALSAVKPRELSLELIKDLSFTDGRITRVFTSFDDAARYAKSISRAKTYPQGAPQYNLGASAPVLTIETKKTFSADTLTTDLLNDGTISYHQVNLVLDKTIKYIGVEFASEFKIEPIKFEEGKNHKCSVM